VLDTEPVIVSDIIKPEDLLEVDPVEHPHMQGVVSENVPYSTCCTGCCVLGPTSSDTAGPPYVPSNPIRAADHSASHRSMPHRKTEASGASCGGADVLPSKRD
jgi:hypothetical protein